MSISIEQILINLQENQHLIAEAIDGIKKVQKMGLKEYRKNLETNRRVLRLDLNLLVLNAQHLQKEAEFFLSAIAVSEKNDEVAKVGTFAKSDLEIYQEMLDGHDWFYSFSDDNGVWNRGKTAQKSLEKIASEKGGEFKKAFDVKTAKVAAAIR